MKRLNISLILCYILLNIHCAGEHDKQRTSSWKSLFNGKDLKGWTLKISGHQLNENFGNTFRVEDGILRVSYDQYDTFGGKFGHIFFNEKFSHYILRLEYRFVGEQTEQAPEWAFRNSGIMFHSQSPESMSKDQEFPVCVEAQFLGGDGKNERSTGNVCTPGTHIVIDGELIKRHCTSSRSKTYHGDQWVAFQLEVHGDSTIKHIVNGEVVLTYEKPQLDESDPEANKMIKDGNILLSEGYIALQAESHPVEFRNIEILLLEK